MRLVAKVALFCICLSMVSFIALAEDNSELSPLPDPGWQNIHPLGIWFDGRVEGYNVPEGCINAPKDFDQFREYYKTCFEDIASKGIDIVVIPNTPNNEYRIIILEEAEKAGVKVVLEILEFVEFIRHADPDEVEAEKMVKEVVKDMKDSPALFAYQLIDEPPEPLYGKMRLISRLLGKYDPAHPSFSCLCVEGSVSAFVKEVGLPALLFDRYPLGMEPNPAQWTHLENCTRNVKASAGDKPLWFVLQTFGIPNRLRMPTLEEVKREIDIAVDNGSSGLFFFLYNSDTQNEHLEGLVNRDGTSTDLWENFEQVVDYARKRLEEDK